MKPPRFPTIEVLESRIAPAGIVTVGYDPLTGILNLTGDGDANDVAVSKTGLNTYRIEGRTGTTLAGVTTVLPAIADLGKVTALTFTGAAGADTLSLQGLNTLATLTVNGDAGADAITLTDVVVKAGTILNLGADGGQIVLAGDDTFGADLTVNYGANGGTATAQPGSAVIVKGALVLNGGVGDDEFAFSGLSVLLGKGVKFTAGDGANTLAFNSTFATVGKSLTGKAIQFDGGAVADTLTIGGAKATILGLLEFNAGPGTNTLQATPTAAKVEGGVTYTGGANDDTFDWISPSSSIKGPVTLALGAGTNSAEFSGASGLLGSSLTVTGGAGADTLLLGALASTDTLSVKGAVSVTQGDGANSLAVNGAQVTFGAGLKVAGGVDDDGVDFSSSLTGVVGKLDVSLAEGSNNFFMGGNVATITGDILITNGGGGGFVDLDPTKLKVGGSVSLITGLGDDTVSILGAFIDIKKSLTINTSGGADIVNIAGDGSVKGDVLIDLGAASTGSQFLDFAGTSGVAGNLKLGGKLMVAAATTGAGNEDRVTITNVSVAKAALLTLSEVDSFLTINNLVALDTVTVNTGAGADTVEIEQGTLFGASSFAKKVSIELGDDIDSLLIGISSAAGSSSFGRFLGGLTVLSGAGADTGNAFLTPAINFFKLGTINSSDI